MGDILNMPNKKKGMPDLLKFLKESDGVSNLRSYAPGELTDDKLMSESAAVRRLVIRSNNTK